MKYIVIATNTMLVFKKDENGNVIKDDKGKATVIGLNENVGTPATYVTEGEGKKAYWGKLNGSINSENYSASVFLLDNQGNNILSESISGIQKMLGKEDNYNWEI